MDTPMLSGATGTSIARWSYRRRMFGLPLFENTLELTTNEVLIKRKVGAAAAIPRAIIGFGLGFYTTYLGKFDWYFGLIIGAAFALAMALRPILMQTFDTSVVNVSRINGVCSKTATFLTPIRRAAFYVIIFFAVRRPDNVSLTSPEGIAYGLIGVSGAMLIQSVVGALRRFDVVTFAVGGGSDVDGFSVEMDRSNRNDIREKLSEAMNMLPTVRTDA